MSKVVVVLEGGSAKAGYSDDKRVQVAVLDHDVFEDQYPKLNLDASQIQVAPPTKRKHR